MATSERTLTEFLQHSGRVLAEAGQGELILRRRDGDDLVVIARGQKAALDLTVRALAQVFMTGDAGRASAVLPWLALLEPADRDACLCELAEVASAAVTAGRLAHLEETLAEWEATALAWWDEQRLRERGAAYTDEEPIELSRPDG